MKSTFKNYYLVLTLPDFLSLPVEADRTLDPDLAATDDLFVILNSFGKRGEEGGFLLRTLPESISHVIPYYMHSPLLSIYLSTYIS